MKKSLVKIGNLRNMNKVSLRKVAEYSKKRLLWGVVTYGFPGGLIGLALGGKATCLHIIDLSPSSISLANN